MTKREVEFYINCYITTSYEKQLNNVLYLPLQRVFTPSQFAVQAFGYVLPFFPHTGLHIFGHLHSFGHGQNPSHLGLTLSHLASLSYFSS